MQVFTWLKKVRDLRISPLFLELSRDFKRLRLDGLILTSYSLKCSH